MFTSKNERDISSNEEQFEKQSDSTSSEWQQQIFLLKEGVHNLQNASSTIKEMKNLGNKRMATSVVTLALGSRPRQGVARLRAKWETQEHSTCSQECKECEGMNPHTPK